MNAQTRLQTEWLTLFHLIPLLRFRTVYVRCSACGQDMIAKGSLADVERSNPITLSRLLVKSVSFVGKFCIVLGALLCWAPMVGLMPASIGFCYRNQYGGWLRKLSWVGLILSLLTTSVGVAALLLSK